MIARETASGETASQPTYKQRVQMFWEWFPAVADRFTQFIDDGHCESLSSEVTLFMGNTLPGFSWAFGPGKGEGHSFTVSGEGQLSKQILAEYWSTHAVSVPGWTFHASRQPVTPEQLKQFAIRNGDKLKIEAQSLQIRTDVDEDDQIIHITAWHPEFEYVPPDQRQRILFIMLDQALGEFGTQMWLGAIRIQPFEPQAGAEYRTLVDLPEFVRHVENYYRWEKLPPSECYSVYEMNEQDSFPRGDTLTGVTCVPDIIMDYFDNDGKLTDNPLANTGVEMVYLAIAADVFPPGGQSEMRGEIENRLGQALEEQSSGRALGGAFGLHHSYIDLLVVDGENSIEIIKSVLDNLGLNGRWEMHQLA